MVTPDHGSHRAYFTRRVVRSSRPRLLPIEKLSSTDPVTFTYSVTRGQHRRFRRRPGAGTTTWLSVWPMFFISCATLEMGATTHPSISKPVAKSAALNASAVVFGQRLFSILSEHRAVEILASIRESNARAQRWLDCLTAFRYTLEYHPQRRFQRQRRLPLPPLAFIH